MGKSARQQAVNDFRQTVDAAQKLMRIGQQFAKIAERRLRMRAPRRHIMVRQIDFVHPVRRFRIVARRHRESAPPETTVTMRARLRRTNDHRRCHDRLRRQCLRARGEPFIAHLLQLILHCHQFFTAGRRLYAKALRKCRLLMRRSGEQRHNVGVVLATFVDDLRPIFFLLVLILLVCHAVTSYQ